MQVDAKHIQDISDVGDHCSEHGGAAGRPSRLNRNRLVSECAIRLEQVSLLLTDHTVVIAVIVVIPDL